MNTRQLRVRYNNEWPTTFLFPVERELEGRFSELNMAQVFSPAHLSMSDNHDFQFMLGHLLEALDMLPYRPDLGFESIWKALDAEFFRVRDEAGLAGHVSRFTVFTDRITGDQATAKGFLPLVSAIPLQTCEFIAKRMLNAHSRPDSHSEAFLTRTKATLGSAILDAFNAKYEPIWQRKAPDGQRRAAGFLRLLLNGDRLDCNGTSCQITSDSALAFLISAVLPQFRNERFHGDTMPPFRSSAAKLKTYAHAYFVFMLAYGLLLETFLYRQFAVITSNEVASSIQTNADKFRSVFEKCLTK